MKLLGVVSTYFPNLEELERNIKSYLPWVDWLIIWENTPKEESKISQVVESLNDSKVEVRTTGKNEFLAYPFNQCIKWAQENGFTHILTMDQDSCFSENQFEKYIQLIKENQQDNIAIYSSTRLADNYPFGHVSDIENAITSGSVYNMDIFQKIGYFREDFLIYMMDIEFGIRVKEKEYRIVSFSGIRLEHEAGYAKKNKSGIIVNNYSAQSTYYIIRNTILTWKIHNHRFSNRNKYDFIKYKILYRSLKIGFENNKALKIKAIWLGLFHGIINKRGQYEV
jgi:rhamnosyltransferase